jgi:Bacterial Ig-like domain (group 3)
MKWRKALIGMASAACVALAAGAMTAGPARADNAPTSTSLSATFNTIYSGLEDNEVLSVSVTGGNGLPAGPFGVFAAGGRTLVCGGTVVNGAGACNMAPNELAPGTYGLGAIFFGDENSGASSSGGVLLTVAAQQPTTTTLTLSAPTVTFGREQSEQLKISVHPVQSGVPGGSVTITAGSATVCTISLYLDDTCVLDAAQLPVGSYQLVATYGGGPIISPDHTATFAGSVSTAQTLTVVDPQPTSTTLALSAASVPLGGEQAETLTATVRPATSGTPTGTVTVASGATPVCTITLAEGTGTCTLTGSQLAIGSYPLTATYNGDDTNAVSSDASQTLTVAKEPTTTSLALSAGTIAQGDEQAELFTVQVDPATSGIPTGTVTVKAGTKAGGVAVCTIILANGMGSCSLTASQLKAGTYQVIATYNGDTTYTVSTSTPPQALTVVAK